MANPIRSWSFFLPSRRNQASKKREIGSRGGSRETEVEIPSARYLRHCTFIIFSSTRSKGRRRDEHENSDDTRYVLLLSSTPHAALLNYFKPLFRRNMAARSTLRSANPPTFGCQREMEGGKMKKEREKVIKRWKKSSRRCRRLSKARPRYIFGWRVVLQRWIALPGRDCSPFRGELLEKQLPRVCRQPRFPANIFWPPLVRELVWRVWEIIVENDQYLCSFFLVCVNSVFHLAMRGKNSLIICYVQWNIFY